MTEQTQIILQIQKVIHLVIHKSDLREHAFLDTLLHKLQALKSSLESGEETIVFKHHINGALRAYLETDLVESYEEPLVRELDLLESMLKNNSFN
ncbi:hypothetical protein [Bacillus sp. m3-13]|uniref:hypothetical protein n=1 Tax=Bacillus sp. m3-13 TaxID=406124 RepID=UPI0001E89C4A|nr:hypothetical protein [Bacillus sp. m3-13]